MVMVVIGVELERMLIELRQVSDLVKSHEAHDKPERANKLLLKFPTSTLVVHERHSKELSTIQCTAPKILRSKSTVAAVRAVANSVLDAYIETNIHSPIGFEHEAFIPNRSIRCFFFVCIGWLF